MLKLADLAVREDFSLGRLRVSPALRLVTGPAGEVHVEPLTMQVLLVLADAKGRVVTRDRLYDECWGGVTVGDYSLNRTITMVRRIAAQAAPGAFRIESIPRTGYRLLVDDSADHCASPATFNWRRSAFAGAIAIGVTALAGFVWFMLDRRPAEPTVALAAAADAQSAELAAGIANSAVAAAATYGSSLRLVDHAGRSRPDFILRVGALRAGSDRKVGLTLVSGANRALVWSWSATRPTNEGEALDRMARDMGGMALSCAAETRSPRGHQPDRETIRLYVNACSKFEPWAGARLSLLTDAFEKVTLQAPQTWRCLVEALFEQGGGD